MQLALGSQIRRLRHSRGITQEALAEALGVTPQAVSRWESGGSYPDMEIIPSIANYFGITIDELFGYGEERIKKIDALAHRICEMNRQNNGVDINISECIRAAREAVIEFPDNDKLLLCLASVLYNAGYVRYGEIHVKDAAGFDCYDTALHRTYAEWQEAILLYEKILSRTKEADLRHRALRELIQLYANIGENDRAIELAASCTALRDCRELMLVAARQGPKRAEQLGLAILELISAAAEQMIQALISIPDTADPAVATQVIGHAIALFDHVCTKGEYGVYHAQIARLYLYLSEFQWRAEDRDGAFESLHRAYEHASAFDSLGKGTPGVFSAPLLRYTQIEPSSCQNSHFAKDLPEVWPWWCVPDFEDIRTEMQADPRWQEWVELTQEYASKE